ncbi:MAG: phosphoenolpyruvate carboxylase [Alphaproteobacteria bacterium]|nr:phosphoenolpyruvate carboxylase [Alphaproteobacteria bacterium]
MPRNAKTVTRKKPAKKPGGRTAKKTTIHDEATALLDSFKPPLLPATACFKTRRGVNTGRLRSELVADLDRIRAGAEEDPFSNSILVLALGIGRRLESGKVTFSALESLIQRLSASTFALRADRMKDYLGEITPKTNEARLRKVVRALAFPPEKKTGKRATKPKKAKPVPFAAFRKKVESELLGVVFTAHPTFGMSGDLMHHLVHLATGRDGRDGGGTRLSKAKRAEIFTAVFGAEHRPDATLDLDREHALSLEAITNFQAAMRRVYDVVFSVADEVYPGHSKDLTPQLLSVASWVGYDVDGRSDITWSDTLHKRLRVQLVQLEYYRHAVNAIIAMNPGPGSNKPLRKALGQIESRLHIAITETEEELSVFRDAETQEESGHERIRHIAKKMHEGLDRRLVDTVRLVKLINDALHFCRNNDIGIKRVRALSILRAELINYGLSMARTHVRINASQLHNAIRKDIGLDSSPDDPANAKTYLGAVNGLLDKVKPVTINFGSVLAERLSGKRLFMIVAQMLKYVDVTTPVRFLIAECETPFTLLTALYFLKLFGIDHKVDISPLFETEKALVYGHRVIDELLENPHYRNYVKKRGRLCIQTGFSDAGRYLGQTAAALSIENLHLNMARVLARHKLKGVQLVIFDTHGESIGRGGHPASMDDRLRYLASPFSRRSFEKKDLSCKEEISFQGGDGYLCFMNEAAALATVSRILEYVLSPCAEAENDPFYEQADYAGEIVNTIKHFNAEIMNNPDYAALLGAFGSNMLYATGSRPVVRQHEGAHGGGALLTHPSQTRAIPQNAILQQLGFLATTLGGIGQVIAKDPDKFQELFKSSPRFRRVMGMVEYAFAFSEIEVFKAYIDLFDPGLWLARAARTADPARSESMRRLAEIFEASGQHGKMQRVYLKLQREYVEIRNWLLGRGDAGRLAVGRGRVIGKDIRDDLLLLHGVRIALIEELFLLAARVPEFSLQTGITRDQVLSQLLSLDVPTAIATLEDIFPASSPDKSAGDFGERATYRGDGAQSYAEEHARIFAPISCLYECIRRAGTGITHFIGALG